MHSEEETFRATLRLRTADEKPHTVIITRRNTAGAARVWHRTSLVVPGGVLVERRATGGALTVLNAVLTWGQS